MPDPEVVIPETPVVEETPTPIPSPEETAIVSPETPEVKGEEETQEVKAEEKKDELKSEPLPEDAIDFVQKGDDGKFFLQAGDSTYYGSTKKEVIENLLKGKVEQDVFIRETKASEKFKSSLKEKTAEKEVEKDIEIPEPNRSEIFSNFVAQEAKRLGVPLELFSLKTDEDWTQYADEKGIAWKIGHLYSKVEAIKEKAIERTESTVADIQLAKINQDILDQESPKVNSAIARSGIDPSKFDYKKIVEAADKSKDKIGMITSGSMMEETTRQIVELLRQQYDSSSKVTADVKKAIANGEKLKSQIKSSTSGGKKTETKFPTFNSQEELTEYLSKGIRAGVY